MTERQLADIVAADLAEDGMPGWEQYADELWEDRDWAINGFPSHLTFLAWRALVRRIAGDLGLLGPT